MRRFYPREIFIEPTLRNSPFARKIIQKLPRAKIRFLKRGEGSKIKDSHLGKDSLFIIRQKSGFLKRCPCAKNHLSCNYYILDLGFGCPYDCSYCYLQGYANFPGIILHANLQDYLENLATFLKEKKAAVLRIGTGEFTDSLALDELSEYSKLLVPFFAKYDNVYLELKTKSDRINNLLDLNHNGRTIISWSLNTEKIITEQEKFTAPLDKRLKAAQICQEKGYKLGFHFDPLVLYDDCFDDYAFLIDKLFQKINPTRIGWISLGTLRFNKGLKSVIRKKTSGRKILYSEFLPGLDGKLRYFRPIRVEFYKFILKKIREKAPGIWIYLCMETREVWSEVFPNLVNPYLTKLPT